MSEQKPPTTRQVGRIKDARGRIVSELDPVRMHLLGQHTPIPAETLRAMTDELMPGARRQRLLQALAVMLGFLIVVGGNIVYFRYFRPWSGLDPVKAAIYVVQVLVILSGPYLAYLMARSRYSSRVGAVMLKHRHCPHCGYDLRLLPADSAEGSTICPECGCAWRLEGEAG